MKFRMTLAAAAAVLAATGLSACGDDSDDSNNADSSSSPSATVSESPSESASTPAKVPAECVAALAAASNLSGFQAAATGDPTTAGQAAKDLSVKLKAIKNAPPEVAKALAVMDKAISGAVAADGSLALDKLAADTAALTEASTTVTTWITQTCSTP